MKTSQTSSISDLVTEYHRLYALTKKPEYLEIAALLGKTTEPNFDELWEKKVNEGCLRENLPLRYPHLAGNETPLPTTKDVE